MRAAAPRHIDACLASNKARNCQLATSCFVLAAPARARGTPSPPPPSDDSTVSGSPSPPDSPRIVCSQYRQAQHDGASAASQAREEPPTFIAFQESVSDRRRRHELGQAPIFKRDRDLQLYVRADHSNPEGQAPLCYVATGYQGDPAPNCEPHQGYMVYNESDFRWARRLNFHLRRLQARAK